MKHETLVQARADEQTFREILDKARTIQQVSAPPFPYLLATLVQANILPLVSISQSIIPCMQAKVAAAMNMAEANAKRAEEIQAAADAAQEQFAQVISLILLAHWLSLLSECKKSRWKWGSPGCWPRCNMWDRVRLCAPDPGGHGAPEQRAARPGAAAAG
jgi:hypothetical protein